MSTVALTEDGKVITLSAKEERLLEALRAVPFGQVMIHMADGEPQRIEWIRESKLLLAP